MAENDVPDTKTPDPARLSEALNIYKAFQKLLKRANYEAGERFLDDLRQRGNPAIALLILLSRYGPRPRIREVAIVLLAELKAVNAFDALTHALQDKHPDVRGAAAVALGEIGDARAFVILMAALNDKHRDVKYGVIHGLGTLGDLRAFEPLLEIAQNYADEDLRAYALYPLGRLKDKRALEPLIAALQDESRHIRFRAAEALGVLGDEGAIDPLIAALRSPDNDDGVKLSVIRGLGEYSAERVVDTLIALLRDSYDNRNRFYFDGDPLQTQTVSVLGKIGNIKAFEILIKSLRKGDEHTISSAAWALGKLGDKRAVEPLVRALPRRGLENAERIAEALGELSDKRAVPALTRTLKEKDKAVRKAAQTALEKSRAANPDA